LHDDNAQVRMPLAQARKLLEEEFIGETEQDLQARAQIQHVIAPGRRRHQTMVHGEVRQGGEAHQRGQHLLAKVIVEADVEVRYSCEHGRSSQACKVKGGVYGEATECEEVKCSYDKRGENVRPPPKL
jgi:hypothetical protein